jgi:Fe-S-cluster formation regulator IscX/YfhJ
MRWYTDTLEQAIELYRKKYGVDPIRGWTDGKIIMLDVPEERNERTTAKRL